MGEHGAVVRRGRSPRGNEALLDNIAANPGQYYINIHTTPTYPAGAIRGQLQRAY